MATQESRGSTTRDSGQSERSSDRSAERYQGVQTDAKIRELDAYVAQQAEQRAGGREAGETVAAQEAATRELEQQEQAAFKAQAHETAPSAEGVAEAQPVQPGARPEKVTVQWLREHVQDPQGSLEALVHLASSDKNGKDAVKPLLEKIAAEEGEAYIVDALHAHLKKLEQGEQG